MTLRARRAKTKEMAFCTYSMKDGNCAECDCMSRCLENRSGKRKYLSIPIERVTGTLHVQMMEKIDADQGRIAYGNRLGMVEPVFANIRTQKRMVGLP